MKNEEYAALQRRCLTFAWFCVVKCYASNYPETLWHRPQKLLGESCAEKTG